MSREKPDSILDMPGTPLLEGPGPSQENSFSGDDVSGIQGVFNRLDEDEEEETPSSPNNLDTNHEDLAVRRKKRFACSGKNHLSHFLALIKKFSFVDFLLKSLTVKYNP